MQDLRQSVSTYKVDRTGEGLEAKGSDIECRSAHERVPSYGAHQNGGEHELDEDAGDCACTSMRNSRNS